MIMRPSVEQIKRRALVVLIAVGVLLGLSALLFATANDDWIVISIPSAPWKTEPSVAAFEARLWAIILVSFIAGVAIAGITSAVFNVEHRRNAEAQIARLRQLETEIRNLNRLLQATMSGQKSRDKEETP